MKKFVSVAVICLVAACSQPDAPKPDNPIAPSMPKGIVRTDGHGAVNVSVAGDAQCRALSASETGIALAQTNAVRAQAGLPPLRGNAKLQKAAQQQACDMARRGQMDHRGATSTGPGMRVKQLGYTPRITAENIAAGASSIFDLNGALREWSSSAKHRENIVIPQLQDMGIGHALSADGRFAYWSVVYSAPR